MHEFLFWRMCYSSMNFFPSSSFRCVFQDMCVVCGSFGKGAEGQLLACAQCAQCYHPYCVNSKVNATLRICLYFTCYKPKSFVSQDIFNALSFLDHKDNVAQGLALFGMYCVRSMRQGFGPFPSATVRWLRCQLSHLLLGPAAAHSAQGRLEMQMVKKEKNVKALFNLVTLNGVKWK